MFNNGNNYEGARNDEKAETIIGPNVRVEGTLTSSGNINIDGEFKGILKVQSKLNVGREADIEAEITAENAFIAGSIKGNLDVKNKLELSSTAKINGDVKAGTMIMEAGSVMNGNCKMNGNGTNTDLKKNESNSLENDIESDEDKDDNQDAN